jgi:photosystem II stability/assembly factor-like uncharacterized protein
MKRPALCWVLAGALAGITPTHAAPADPLQVPAAPSALAVRSPLFAITTAGTRLVAVGQRGHILTSNDAGAHWQQVQAPVSTDLVAVHFPSPQRGWAVGHDGVILHSADGGRHWSRQLDGRQAAALIEAAYAGGAAGPEADAALREARRMLAEGPDLPFLDVWFSDERNGTAVGAFNLIFVTSDGGVNWRPASHLADNPKGYHLYGVRASGGDVYIVGELGLVLRLDRSTQRFSALATPYRGTFFGLLASRDLLLAYGLRGNAWRSRDAGRTWQPIDTGLVTGITGAASLGEGRIAMVSQGGQVLISRDNAASFEPMRGVHSIPVFGVSAAGAGALALVGARGVRIQAVP